MGLINRKPGNKDAIASDWELEHAKIRMALYTPSYSEQHPVKHWAFARIDPPTMKAIGEDPQEFAKFRDEFRNAIKPNDDFEDLLAGKMVEARWRQFRLLKAEAAILAQGRCQFVMDRRRQLAEPQGGMSGVNGAAPPFTGPVSTTSFNEPGTQPHGTPSRSRFVTLVKFLKTVRGAVKSEGFQGESLKLLESVSEPEVAATTALVAVNSEHSRVETAENRSIQEGPSKNFLAWLDTEITAFEELDKLDHAAEAELSGYAFDARLLLPDGELEKIRRYQAVTERQFDAPSSGWWNGARCRRLKRRPGKLNAGGKRIGGGERTPPGIEGKYELFGCTARILGNFRTNEQNSICHIQGDKKCHFTK
jgi:hypothetical protein